MSEFKIITGDKVDYNMQKTINDNTTLTKDKLNEQKGRVDNLIKGTPQPSEVVDARGGLPVLRDRLNNFDAQLAQKAMQSDLDNANQKLIQKVTKSPLLNDFITGDSKLIAHRCAGYIYPDATHTEKNIGFPPENSIASLYKAMEVDNFWGVEIDIKPASDDWVVSHDGDLPRTHNGDTTVIESTASWTLATKPYAYTNPSVTDFRYYQEGICSLYQFLYVAKDLKTNVIIELKVTYFKDGYLDKLYNAINNNKMLDNVILLVSDVTLATLIREKFGYTVPVAILFGASDTTKMSYLKENVNTMAMTSLSVISSIKDELNANSIPIMMYGINTIDAVKYYGNMGVKGFATDTIIGGER